MIAPRQVGPGSRLAPWGHGNTGLLSVSRFVPGALTSSSRTALGEREDAPGPTNARCRPSAVQDSASTFMPPKPSPPLLGLHCWQVLKLHDRLVPAARSNTYSWDPPTPEVMSVASDVPSGERARSRTSLLAGMNPAGRARSDTRRPAGAPGVMRSRKKRDAG